MSPQGPIPEGQQLSAEEVETLKDLVTAIRTGRSIVWALLRAGAFATALFALAYYALGVFNGWHAAMGGPK